MQHTKGSSGKKEKKTNTAQTATKVSQHAPSLQNLPTALAQKYFSTFALWMTLRTSCKISVSRSRITDGGMTCIAVARNLSFEDYTTSSRSRVVLHVSLLEKFRSKGPFNAIVFGWNQYFLSTVVLIVIIFVFLPLIFVTGRVSFCFDHRQGFDVVRGKKLLLALQHGILMYLLCK